jgi:thiosulfate/3-mercaptopyruvate sulfurtransferase
MNMTYTTLISTGDFAAHLDDPDWAIVDCRFQLQDLDFGHRAYEESHIPGAIYAHLNDDLSGPIIRGATGRHPLPPAEVAADRFSALGIEPGVQVVAYDDAGGALAAARLWWMLRWLGHDRVAVLDGGWPKWQQEGRSTRSGLERRAARQFEPHARPGMVVDANDVLHSIGDPNFRLFDARTAERYRGENETIDPVAGHIPGAISVPYLENLDSDGRFKSREELRAKYQALLGSLQADQSAFYCGSGGTAPLNILAMMHAGLGEAKLYAGSWSDWILDPARLINTGSES